MSYSVPLPQQLQNFLLFFGFGFLSGFLFRSVEFFRGLFGEKKAAVIAQDLIFSFLVTVLFFVFLLTYADGIPRLNLIFSSSLGAAVFFLTVGKAVKRVFDFLSAVLKKTVSLISSPFFAASRALKKVFQSAGERAKTEFQKRNSALKKAKSEKEKKKIEKTKVKSKKHLKNREKSI